MSRIVRAEALLVDLEVETVRTDAVQAFLKQETPIVRLTTADGAVGTGYSYTIGTGGSAVLAMLRDYLLQRLIGQDSAQPEAVWADLFGSTRSTTTGPITSLALAAVDTAMWDLRGLQAGRPLWQEAGGFRDRVPLYDTEGGWLHLDTDKLVIGAEKAKANGWPGVKLKVGKKHVQEDLERLQAVREAVGDDMDLMVDANQSMTLAEARRRARAVAAVDIYWFAEPLPADDGVGHAQLASSTSIPIAVGESLYSLSQFQQYLNSGAAAIIQVDVARVGGITPWLKVAHMAEAFNVKVAPHFLMELHVSLAAAIPNGLYVEHIPQLRPLTRSAITIKEGMAVAPEAPGLGIDWDEDAVDRLRVA